MVVHKVIAALVRDRSGKVVREIVGAPMKESMIEDAVKEALGPGK